MVVNIQKIWSVRDMRYANAFLRQAMSNEIDRDRIIKTVAYTSTDQIYTQYNQYC